MTVLAESRSIAEVLNGRNHLYVDGVSWEAYEALLEELEDQGRRLRHTYDRGRLEIMTRPSEHETPKELIGWMIGVLAEELELPIYVGGELTVQRKRVKRGIEPDQCYWIANEPLVRGKHRINFKKDPPPDLFVEVEVSRTIIDRLPVLGALRVAEVWRFSGKKVKVGLLQPDGQYRWGEHSSSFPGIAIGELARFLHMARRTDHTTVLRAFRGWVRQQLGK
jgi:Uma2 family endonuclease